MKIQKIVDFIIKQRDLAAEGFRSVSDKSHLKAEYLSCLRAYNSVLAEMEHLDMVEVVPLPPHYAVIKQPNPLENMCRELLGHIETHYPNEPNVEISYIINKCLNDGLITHQEVEAWRPKPKRVPKVGDKLVYVGKGTKANATIIKIGNLYGILLSDYTTGHARASSPEALLLDLAIWKLEDEANEN